MIYPNKQAAQEALNKAVASIKEIQKQYGVWVWNDSEYHGSQYSVSFYNEKGQEDFIGIETND